MYKEIRPKHWPTLEQCNYGIFSEKLTVKGDLIINLIEHMMPMEPTLYKVEPPLTGIYSRIPLISTLVEWIRAYPQGFEITIKDMTTFAVYQKGVDPDTVPWVGEFEIPGL